MQLVEVLDQVTMQECKTLMESVRECRHNKVLERQKRKFEALVLKSNGHSKQDVQKNSTKDDTNEDQDGKNREKNKWVINLSSTPTHRRPGEAFGPQAKICNNTQGDTC